MKKSSSSDNGIRKPEVNGLSVPENMNDLSVSDNTREFIVPEDSNNAFVPEETDYISNPDDMDYYRNLGSSGLSNGPEHVNKKNSSNKNKTVKIIIGSILGLAAIGFGIKLAMTLYQPKATLTATMSSTTTEPTGYTTPDPELAVIPTYTTRVTDPSAESYVCPADFEYLQSVNDDIYAWLHIEGMYVDFPVCQSPNDDEFYLSHNSDGEFSSAGAIFTEHEFNGKDFNDPVTILYGHHMGSRCMFGDLQEDISEEEFWAKNPVITIYMPDRELRYQVFAAVPYGHWHILYYHDFTDESVYTSFFDDIMSTTGLAARTHEEFAPVYGDKVIVLSTCLIGNHYNRFVVMGKLIYDSAEVNNSTVIDSSEVVVE